MWTAVGILFSKSGGAVEKIWRGNPVIRAVVIIAVALVLLDLAARESLSLWREGFALQRDAATLPAQIDKTNAEAAKSKEDAQRAVQEKCAATGMHLNPLEDNSEAIRQDRSKRPECYTNTPAPSATAQAETLSHKLNREVKELLLEKQRRNTLTADDKTELAKLTSEGF